MTTRETFTLPEAMPLLSRMLGDRREEPLTFSYGVNQQGGLVTTTLPEAAPILILHSCANAHKQLLCVLLAQFYAKYGAKELRFASIEQVQELTPLLQEHPLTTLVTKTPKGIIEAIWFLEQELYRREHTQDAVPPWLVVLGIDEALQQYPQTWQACHDLLSRGYPRGLFFFVVAHRHSAIASALPDVFATTLVVTETGEPLATTRGTGGEPALSAQGVSLYRAGEGTSPTLIAVPLLDPHMVLRLLNQVAPQVQSEEQGGVQASVA